MAVTDTETTTPPGSGSNPISGGSPTVTPAQADKPAAAPIWLRIVQGLAATGLIVGFFMPWITLGELVSLSGFSMVLTGGEAVERLSAPSRGLIFSIPLIGLALLATSLKGFRGLAWTGMATGILIVLVGLYTLISAFLDSTGMGMWLVSGSAMLALGTGALALRLAKGR
jgi:hypothetical protein